MWYDYLVRGYRLRKGPEMRRWIRFGLILTVLSLLGLSPSNPSLRIFVDFDDGNLQTAKNLLEEEGCALLRGEADISDGVRGYAPDFIDEDGFYEMKVLDPWIFSPQGFSVGFWFYHRGIEKDTVLLHSAPLEVRGDPVYPNRIEVVLRFRDGDREVLRLPLDLPEREWIHLAVVVNNGMLTLYLNGKPEARDTFWHTVLELARDEDLVREAVYLASDGERNRFNGKLDEISWFSKAVEEYDVAELI